MFSKEEDRSNIVEKPFFKKAIAIISKRDLDMKEFVKSSMEINLKEKNRLDIIESLKKGYVEMSKINRDFSEYGFEEDYCDLRSYEEFVGDLI